MNLNFIGLVYRLGSPRWFYQKTQRWLPWLSLMLCSLCYRSSLGLAYAPPDAKQAIVFVLSSLFPASVVALAGYYIMAIAGGLNLAN